MTTSRSRVDDMVAVVPGILGSRLSEGIDEGGDGRVPRLSRAHVAAGRPAYTPREKHGSLQNNTALRQALSNWLAPGPPAHRGPEAADIPLVVDAPDAIVGGEVYELRAAGPPDIRGHDRVAVFATAEGRPVRTLDDLGGGRYAARPAGLAAGPHRVAGEHGERGPCRDDGAGAGTGERGRPW